jgi:hypothetical protein
VPWPEVITSQPAGADTTGSGWECIDTRREEIGVHSEVRTELQSLRGLGPSEPGATAARRILSALTRALDTPCAVAEARP